VLVLKRTQSESSACKLTTLTLVVHPRLPVRVMRQKM